MAIAKYKFTRHNCNRKAKEHFDRSCEHFQVNPKDFKGVELTDFPQLEKYYETQLFAMFLKEGSLAKTLYLSPASFPTKIYMNVYENQLSLITDSKGIFFWYLLFSAGCLPFLVGFKILFFWYCLPKAVGLEGLPDLLLFQLEGFADFERILVLMCFLYDNLASEPRF